MGPSDGEQERVIQWVAQNFVRINQRLAELGEAIERLEGGTSDVESDAAQKSDNLRHLPNSPAAPARVTKLGTGGQDEPADSSEEDETLDPAADRFDSEGDETPGGSDQRE